MPCLRLTLTKAKVHGRQVGCCSVAAVVELALIDELRARVPLQGRVGDCQVAPGAERSTSMAIAKRVR
jgi:hypothetical protein